MAIRLTIDMFSGRPNPTIELSSTKLPGRMKVSTAQKLLVEGTSRVARPSTLGYRGIIVEDTTAKGFRPRRVDEDATSVRDLLARLGKKQLADFIIAMQPASERAKLGRALKTFSEWAAERENRGRDRKKVIAACKCAPLYEPTWWNDGGQRQLNNNCYNYSTNYRTDTFAQPGQAAGQMYAALTCAAVHTAALADDVLDTKLVNKCPPEGHLVALVVAPGFDYHWYRKGRDGLWTHKPGHTPVTNVDNSGHIITDPRTADRGPYTDFCSFMVVMHGHIKIR